MIHSLCSDPFNSIYKSNRDTYHFLIKSPLAPLCQRGVKEGGLCQREGFITAFCKKGGWGIRPKIIGRLITMDEFFQREGVLDGKAIGVIVKIDKDISPFLCPAFDLLSPSFQLFV